jgi:hypothetical protein
VAVAQPCHNRSAALGEQAVGHAAARGDHATGRCAVCSCARQRAGAVLVGVRLVARAPRFRVSFASRSSFLARSYTMTETPTESKTSSDAPVDHDGLLCRLERPADRPRDPRRQPRARGRGRRVVAATAT